MWAVLHNPRLCQGCVTTVETVVLQDYPQRQLIADLSSEKDILLLSHLRIVEYSMSLDTSRLKVTFADFECPPDIENTRG